MNDLNQTKPTCRRNLLGLAVLTSAVVALIVVSPFVWRGNASGHDYEFHLYSWIDAAHSWQAHFLVPRWASLSNYKYGEPRFIFYPPLSWTLGAWLSFVLPWRTVPATFIVLVLTFAGSQMYRLAREFLSPAGAVVAGAIYAANPYHLLDVYFRSAFAELLTSAFLPLLVVSALRLTRDRWRAVAPLALAFAAMWLSDGPAALVASYALALLLVLICWQERAWTPLLFGGAGIVLGFLLTGFYLVPALAEEPWVKIGEVLSEGLKVDENFLFARIPDQLHTQFNFLVSWIAVLQMASLLLLVWGAWSARERFRKAWWPWLGVGAVASLVMLRITAPLWHFMPKAQFIQFPWRWLMVLSLCVSLLAAVGLPGRGKYVAWAVAAVVAFGVAHYLIAHCWWDPGGTDQIVAETHSIGYEGSDEYAPAPTDHYDLAQQLPPASFLDERGALTDAHPEAIHRRPEAWDLTVTTPVPRRLMLRLLTYPAWRVEVNGQKVAAQPRAGTTTGEMVIPLPAGRSAVSVTFVRTWDRWLGAAISALGLVLLFVVFFVSPRRAAAPA